MTMSDDVRAAAERFREYERRVDAGESPKAVDYLVHDDDLADLARAYLAEHPADDGEPVSEAWLESVGLVSDGPPNPTYTAESKGSRGGPVCTLNVELWMGCDGFSVGTVYRELIPTADTRGEFRALCRVLRIPLTEQA